MKQAETATPRARQASRSSIQVFTDALFKTQGDPRLPEPRFPSADASREAGLRTQFCKVLGKFFQKAPLESPFLVLSLLLLFICLFRQGVTDRLGLVLNPPASTSQNAMEIAGMDRHPRL